MINLNQLPPPHTQIDISTKMFLGKPAIQESNTFVPQLQILQEAFTAEKGLLTSQLDAPLETENITQLPTFKELVSFITKNLGDLVHDSHQAAVLAGEESELVLKAALKQRGLTKKIALWGSVIPVSMALYAVGIATKSNNLVVAGIAALELISIGFSRTAELYKIGEKTLELAKKIKV